MSRSDKEPGVCERIGGEVGHQLGDLANNKCIKAPLPAKILMPLLAEDALKKAGREIDILAPKVKDLHDDFGRKKASEFRRNQYDPFNPRRIGKFF